MSSKDGFRLLVFIVKCNVKIMGHAINRCKSVLMDALGVIQVIIKSWLFKEVSLY